ncbi:MAG: hypothetical protein NVSMB52_11490 [Chloroflexota bacterium]
MQYVGVLHVVVNALAQESGTYGSQNDQDRVRQFIDAPQAVSNDTVDYVEAIPLGNFVAGAADDNLFGDLMQRSWQWIQAQLGLGDIPAPKLTSSDRVLRMTNYTDANLVLKATKANTDT